jgi:hypothetical protein
MRYGSAIVAFTVMLLASAHAEAQFAARPAPLPPAENFHVELALNWWTPTPELVIGSPEFSVVGSNTIDFVQEFAIENKRFREFRATIKPGRKHKIRFSYVPVLYEQSTQITRTITINGRTFPVTATVDSKVDWKLWRYGYEWDFVARSAGFVGLIGELKYNKVSASLTSAQANVTATADATAPVPTVGIIARGYPHKVFSITGEFTGFKVPSGFGENFDAKFYDFDLYGMVNIGRAAAVQFGYRSIVTDYLVDDDSGDLKLKGPYIGGSIRF